jgi:TolB-like protein/Tfp pilus assembly protein PilF
MSFFAELKRRNVLRAAALYIGAAWALSQGVAQLLPVFDFPNWVIRWFVIAAMIGFPFAMLFSWFYEWTPQGIKRESEVEETESITHETGKRLDRWIIAVLSVAVVLLLANTFVLHKDNSASVAAQVPDKSIAVLPFIDLSPGHDQAYFSDGMSEEILNALAQVNDLKVAGRTSSFYFKDRNEDLRTVGKALGVANILEGSVRKQGDKVRITAQLIRAADDTHLWSHEYDGDLSDVFKLQEDIARAITDQLKVVLVGAQKTVLARETTQSTEAHQQYLRGQYFWHQRGLDNLQVAVTSYKAAIAADPDYADAWAGLAQTWAILPEYYDNYLPTTGPLSDTMAQALDAAAHALRLDPHSSAALLARAYIRGTHQYDWAGAESDFRAVLVSSPRDATAHQWYGEILNYQRRYAEADAQLAITLKIDPLSPIAQHLMGYSLALQGKYDQALPFFEESLRIAPGFYFAKRWRAVTLVQLHRYDEALAASRDFPDDLRASMEDLVHGLRDPSRSDAAAQAILARPQSTELLTPIELSMLGHNDLAMIAIERMFQQYAPFRATLYAAVQLDALHSNSRFQALMRQMNLPPAPAGAKAASP